MDTRTAFGRMIGRALAIRLAAVLGAGLLAVALLAPLALSGRTAAPSDSVSSSASPRTTASSNAVESAASASATISGGASIPTFPSIATDAAATPGTFHSGEVAVYADASGGKLLIRFRDVLQVADPAGVQPKAPGDVFLEVTLDVKALSATTFPDLQKVFGGQELTAGSAWPTPYLVIPDTLAPGQIVSGKLGFEVPPTGEVSVLLPGRPEAGVRLELRPAPTGPTPSPVAPNGWPVTFDGNAEPIVGPDGTVYTNGIALDSSGRPASGRVFALPGVSTGSAAAFGADGTIYVVGTTADQSKTVIGAFAPDGTLRSGWPVSVDGFAQLVPVPTGGLYVYSWTDTASGTRLFGSDGSVRASWPVAGASDVVGQDGSLYALTGEASGLASHLNVLGANGSRTTGKTTDWQALGVAPSGAVYAWTWDLAADSDTKVVTTRIAAIGPDGNPEAGWPVSVAGSASAPAFGADGTVYLTLGAFGATSSVLALDPTGHTKPGWPARLPAGYSALSQTGAWHAPDVAQPVTIGLNGTIFVAAESASGQPLVTAFDSAGRVKSGWPYRPPASFVSFGRAVGGYSPETPPLFAPSGSSGLLYLVLQDRIVALSDDGKVAPGWPKELTGERSWATTPDGGLVVCAGWNDAGQNQHTTITRWTAAGDLAP